MTGEAKSRLAAAIRGLRTFLVGDPKEAGSDAARGALDEAIEGTYRLSLDVEKAGLDEAARRRRERLVAWVAEQCRADAGESGRGGKGAKASQLGQLAQGPVSKAEAARHLHAAATQAAYTLLHRLVVLRRLEALKLRALPVLTGGFESRGYREFRELAPQLRGSSGPSGGTSGALSSGALSNGALSNGLGRGLSGTGGRDETEGYAFLLDLVFADLATELPGVFGPAGIAELLPVPAAVLRRVVETLDEPELVSAWTDELVLGWVYQYWNDPAREALDDKLNRGGKVEGHELASKTQLFTERYMVDWLLQNSLGPTWLSICARHGWTADLDAIGPDGLSTLQRLEARRGEFRERRERGEVSLTELMPLHTELERRWAYYVPQPIPDDAVSKAPSSVRALKILDPAVGSGHFLVVALELLLALYEEEARHRGMSLAAFVRGDAAAKGDEAIATGSVDDEVEGRRLAVERILSENLHGIDLDPRAIQIAAATLWIQGKALAPKASPPRLNLVASDLRLGALRHDDPALVELRAEVERETGIPASLTDAVVGALKGADHLGSLLKIDRAVEEALDAHERALGLGVKFAPVQTSLFGESAPQQGQMVFDREVARASLTDRLEAFLARHTRADDLGLRLRGEQLAAGVRLARMLREGNYDLVVANPPYQGTSKMADAKYVASTYPLGKADLYAAFLLRGLELVREGGVSAMLTMRNWMFIKQYAGLRERLLSAFDLRALGDFEVGAFEEVGGFVVSVAASAIWRLAPTTVPSVALKLTSNESDSAARTARKRAATLAHVGRHEFDPAALKVVPEWPLVYWWTLDFLQLYASLPEVVGALGARNGLQTNDNTRFLRSPWELDGHRERGWRDFVQSQRAQRVALHRWVPYIRGASGSEWCDEFNDVIRWAPHGMEVKVLAESIYGSYTRSIANEELYFERGVAFTTLGASFNARSHARSSVFGNMGRSVFRTPLAETVCSMNSALSRGVMQDLNPTVHFTTGDVNRLPWFPIEQAQGVFNVVEAAFGKHESHREPSVEFRSPGPSPWRHAQDWAQAAVDRPEGAPLPEYVEELDPEPASDHVSFALGVALGRFGADGEGILDPKTGRPVPVPTPTFLGETDATSGDADGADATRTGTALRATGMETEEETETALRATGTETEAEAETALRATGTGMGTGTGTASSTDGPNLLLHALPHGLLFLDRTLDDADLRDGLGHPAAKVLHEAWATYGPSHPTQWTTRSSLRDFLALDFFKDVHKGMYENRPIHWPLSSEKKTFVAWVNIHRMDARTLTVLLADHLQPRLTQIEGELADLRAVRDGTSGDPASAAGSAGSADPANAKKAAKAAEKQLGKLLAAKDELEAFIADVAQCAERGPLPTDAKCPPREQDAPYDPDLDDGVMINSSALWKLLEPQWKDPKKWWKELASAAPAPDDPKSKAPKGKDYDWSHLAMRYFPTRVDEKCRRDPSLGVAHGCFWRYHPERAWAWELRLQDEIGQAEDGGPFRIREQPYRPGGRDLGDPGDETHRATFLQGHADAAIAALEKEAIRRMGRGTKRKRVDTFDLHEPGLWSAHAARLYELELTLSERQGHPLTIHAPDEPEARAAYERAHPEAVTDRTHRLTALKPLELLGEDDDEGEDVEESDDDETADHDDA
ncbi:MAG: BREX-6 system adenine-specific DNA-methyltransferase PglX [Myxococcota bacterium]|nr:BREX-6 system adenine-specific DNA-methyltransferase PglX [Myxococcota bacterium]